MRRHLMMGRKLTDEEFVYKHMVCWYSPKKQGATNEGLAADPRLVDLSGHGNDMNIVGLNYTTTSGIQSDGGLHLWGGYAFCDSDIVLRDFTVIAKWQRNLNQYIGYPCVMSKETTFRLNQNIGFEVCWSFGVQMQISHTNGGITYMTPKNYNGEVQIDRGGESDSTNKKLVLGFIKKPSDEGWKNHTTIYDVLLFNRTLTEKQIQWVVDNLINGK